MSTLVVDFVNRWARCCASVLVLGSGVCLSATVSMAASVVNNDERSYTIKITHGVKRDEHTLAPTDVLADVCGDGCLVSLVGIKDGDYVLKGNERVAIENGRLFYDDVEGDRPAAPFVP